MNVGQIIEAALARAMEFHQNIPNTESVSIRRIDAHQQELFAYTAGIAREYIGRSGVLTLAAGIADTADLNPLAMRIVLVRIQDEGSSDYEALQRVNIIPVDDPDAALAPRATLRDGLITGYDGELDDVTSLMVDYCKRPGTLTVAADVPEFAVQYHEILVIDLTKQMIRKTIGLNSTSREEILEILQEEYDETLGQYEAHLRNFSFAEVSRHGRTAPPG